MWPLFVDTYGVTFYLDLVAQGLISFSVTTQERLKLPGFDKAWTFPGPGMLPPPGSECLGWILLYQGFLSFIDGATWNVRKVVMSHSDMTY